MVVRETASVSSVDVRADLRASGTRHHVLGPGEAALAHVAAQVDGDVSREPLAWSSLCQVLFNTNAFITVD